MALTVSLSRLRRLAFGIDPTEASFARRGFHQGDPVLKQRLERTGAEFLLGYHAAIELGEPDKLPPLLERVSPEFRGFAFEGAGMGLALLDVLTPWRRGRLRRFLAGPGADHAYMVHVGAGWALARIRRRITSPPPDLDPLLGWLALDGFGFHDGYFAPDRYVRTQGQPRAAGDAARVFDQGLGRSIWFIDCGDVARIPRTIAAFAPSRHHDLWSGVGLAAAYAGGADAGALATLQEAAGPSVLHLAQGVAFAAKARERAQNQSAGTELAARVICGLPATAAAEITDLALRDCRRGHGGPAYDAWRREIRECLARTIEGSFPQ